MAKFPDVVMLDIDQIASLTRYSKGHIYNLASADKLPFKPARELGDRILVSIVEMADYLDSKMLSKVDDQTSPEPIVSGGANARKSGGKSATRKS
jgi:hypothetical protein